MTSYNLDSLDWQPGPSISKTELKLNKLAKLREGWRYGEGKALKPENVKRARQFNQLLEENKFDNKDIFPGVEGDLTLELYFDNETLEITFEDGRISFAVIEDNEYIQEEVRDETAAAVKYLTGFLQEKCKSYGSSISMNIVNLREDSSQNPFKIYVGQSLLSNVAA